jgi:hypothetical protein
VKDCHIRANFSGPFVYDFRTQSDTGKAIEKGCEIGWGDGFEGSEPALEKRTHFSETTLEERTEMLKDAPDGNDEHDDGNGGDVGSDVAESGGSRGS